MADISKIKPLGSDTTYDIKDNSAVANITRSGTTFTATRRDGTTFTFSQQDNNTDTLVKQTAKTDDVNYKILTTTSASPTSGDAAEAAYDTDITLNPSTNTITATNFAGSATNAKNTQSNHGQKSFTINGDANTYYPTWFSGFTTRAASTLLSIHRTYDDTAPDTWNTSTHRGGLTLTILSNGDTAWGGNHSAGINKLNAIIVLSQDYCTMVGDICDTNFGLVVWLRGGGAKYYVTSNGGRGVSVTTWYEEHTQSSNTVAPITTVNTTRINQYKCENLWQFATATKVSKSLTLKIKSGATEGTDLYTFNGSATKTLDIKQGTGISLTAAAGSATIGLATITKSDTTSTTSPAHSGTFTAIDSVTYDNYGRVTGVNTKTVTLPSDNNTTNTAGSTNTTNKIFLVGAETQGANPQTYSNVNVYTQNSQIYSKGLNVGNATNTAQNLDGHLNLVDANNNCISHIGVNTDSTSTSYGFLGLYSAGKIALSPNRISSNAFNSFPYITIQATSADKVEVSPSINVKGDLGTSSQSFNNLYVRNIYSNDALTINTTTSLKTITISSASTMYLTTAGNSSIVFSTNNTIRSRISPEGHFLLYVDNTYTLGSAGGNRWKALYVGTADSYGSASLPIFWNNGVPTACTASSLFSKLSWTDGTTSGPVLSTTVAGQTRTATIPSASSSVSGVVTTGTQTFSGDKTFAGNVNLSGETEADSLTAGNLQVNGSANFVNTISGSINGNAATATTASQLSNTSKIGDTNKPVYFTASGVPAAISYTIGKSVPSDAVFTDRYVNSATFADDSTNTAASPVKMTLTRAGSDTAIVTANIPKVSSSSAGVAPKGATVSSQSQSTKFLREDGTWAAPSYTTNTNTTYTIATGDSNGQIKVTPSSGSAYNVDVKGLGSAAYQNDSRYKTRITGTKNLSTAGWYRILDCTNYSMAFLITFFGGYTYQEPTPVTFLVSHEYNDTSISQIGRSANIGWMTKIRAIRHNTSQFYIDIYYAGNNTNNCNFEVTPLDPNSRSFITKIDYTAITDELTSYVECSTDTLSRADKFYTARSLKTKLDSTTAVTFDGSADQNAIPVTGTLPIGNGGTGATTAAEARTNLGLGSMATETAANYILKSVLSGAYDIMYSSAANTPARLAANTTTTKKFLRMTGTGSAGAAPAWDTVTKSDVGLSNVTNHQQVHEVAWDSTNKKITRSKNGTAGDVVQFVAGSNVTLTAENGKLTIASSYTNTDTKVTQGTTTTTSWRKVLLNGGSDNTYSAWNTAIVEKTDVVYQSKDIAVQPSTGSMAINKLYVKGTYPNIVGNGTGIYFSIDGNWAGSKGNICIEANAMRPSGASSTAGMNLGASGNRWSKLYVGTADSYGSTSLPVYWNAGVPATISNLNLPGTLDVTGNTSLHNETTIDSGTIGSMVVTGGASFAQIPTAPTAATSDNSTKLATTEFVYNAFTTNDAMVFKGVVNANSDLPATHKQGWTYKIGTAGTYAGQTCEIGDTIYCIADGTAADNTHWVVVQNNIDGTVFKGANAFTDTHIIIADGTNGKVKDSGYTIATSVPSEAVFTDTKNTAGSTDTSSKIYLIGATSQAANPQTYSDNEVFVTNGTLSTKNITVSGNATLSGETEADSLTAGNLQVNGSATFVNTINGNVATASKVTQNASANTATDYRILLSTAAADTETQGALNKDTDLRWNPSTNTLDIAASNSNGVIKTTSGSITLNSAATIYLNKPNNSSIIFTAGGADTSHVNGCFSPSGVFVLGAWNTTANSSTHKLYVQGTSAFTDSITLTDNSNPSKSTINYSRVGYNYINIPTGGSFAVSVNGPTGENIRFAVDNTSVRSYTTNSVTLGTSVVRWKALYIGTADSYGTANKPVYWNAGVPAAVSDNSVLTNLGSTAAASIYAASPRPGVTGTLGAANGGTGKTSLIDAANALLNALSTGSSTPVDADYYISQYVSGGTTTTTYHRRPMSALWEYIKGKITNGIYWANVKTTSAATYKAQPEVASVKVNGKTASGDADTASTKNVQLVYDASLEVLNFVFS